MVAGRIKVMRASLIVGNLLCLLFAIVVLSISIGTWYVYGSGTFTILVSIFALVAACSYKEKILIVLAAVCGIDGVLMVASAIAVVVRKGQVTAYCFEGDTSVPPPPNGCDYWRHQGHYSHATAVLVLLFIGGALRLINILGSLGLAREFYYNGGQGLNRKEIEVADRAF